MANVKLKRLKIEKYRNVAPGTELVFNDGFNVLLGQNGTGKTTLLKLIAMVTASRFGSLKETEFSLSYTLEFAGASINVEIQNARSDSDPLLNEPFAWSYNVVLAVEGLPHTWTARATMDEMLVYAGEQPRDSARVPVASPFERSLLMHALSPIRRRLSGEHPGKYFDVITKFMLFELRNVANGRRFDELLGGLDAITGAVSSNDSPAASFQLFRRPNGISLQVRDGMKLIPHQLQQRMLAHKMSSQSLDIITAKHEEVDFLREAVDLMGFKGADLLLRLQRREPIDDGELLTFGKFEFTIVLEDKAIISHDALSYGQKRLLAFLYYVAANEDVIIADEIVNGMHYDWIGACVKSIGSRQAFLTSQNPLLLDFLSFETAEDVQRTFVLCQTAKQDQRTHISWTNLSQRDARSFYRAYDTGAQHVSEILRSKGLW